MNPVRIQRRRTSGYSMQAESRAINGLDCISVTRPGRWGNPYDIQRFGRELSLAIFRNTIEGIWSPEQLVSQTDELCDLAYAAHGRFLKRLGAHPLEIIKDELGSHNLGCFCSLDVPCHADVLLEIANREPA